MKYKLTKKEKSRAGNVYIVLNFAGGDADTSHPEEVLLKGITFDGGKDIELPLEAMTIIERYKILKKVLDNDKYKYNKVKEEFGEEIAKLYDNAPNDPQGDYQFKCYLSSMELRAYDSLGAMYEGYI